MGESSSPPYLGNEAMMEHANVHLIHLLDSLPISDWGVADIRGLHPLAEKYPTAISMLFGYDYDADVQDDGAFRSVLDETRVTAKQAMGVVLEELERMGAPYYAVGTVGVNVETLTGDFQAKTAATRAGLGWIGKNGLLVTEIYGPRVRLEAILVDLDLPPGQPIVQSHCGDCCICVDGCPSNSLKNTGWLSGMERNGLMDAHACFKYRSSFKPSLGRLLACGRCALNCPKGR